MLNYVYEMVDSSPPQFTNNFTRISADMERLKVEVFGRKGELLYVTEFASRPSARGFFIVAPSCAVMRTRSPRR